MTSQEKDQLLALLLDVRHWCRSAEARSGDGQPVTYSDPEATAWDLTGAVCHLFGWRRACELFIQIDRRLHPRARAALAGDAAITAMVSLQSWNDDPQMSHPELLAVLERLPVSNRAGNGEEPSAAAPDNGSDKLPGGSPPTAPGSLPDGSVA
jgi:hypothetical protein